ncbi:MAG TPA: FG-GAP-like repeat-containing protein [Edaphobacter sp.]|nr:FG-GAP-like repeat-containing protein [Edaphobacter sp.]
MLLRKHLRHPSQKPQSGGTKHKRTKAREMLVFAVCSFVPGLAFVSKSCAQVIEPPQARVSTATELQNALNAADSSKFRCIRPYVIWVENDAAIDMDGFIVTNSANNFLLSIPGCVTLASGRSATVDGGLLFQNSTSAFQQFMLSLGTGARVTGLRLRGPSSSSNSMPVANGAIVITGVPSATVDNNEIFNWPLSAVNVSQTTNNQSAAQQINVSGNFIHDNVMCGLGYGVVVGKSGYAYISRNLFDDNRHAVSDDGCVSGGNGCSGDTGYIAELNFVLAEGAKCPSSFGLWNDLGVFEYYNQHFDVHGLGSGCGSESHCGGAAGQFFDIHNNAIRGDQTYDNFLWWGKTRPAFQLRGTPTESANFHDNALAHDNQGDAISTPAGWPSDLHVSNIQYNVDTSYQLAVGDFDGDGCTDVFQATGAVWVYSPCGRREWRYLNDSSIKLSGLAFGDFNGDGKTDVFSQEGSQWLVSYSGTGPWTPLPAGSNIPMSSYGFADFDGDGKTDIMKANGTEWSFSSGGATQWQHLNFSKLAVKDLRFGHFNFKDLKKADIFAIVDGQWSVSFGGTSKWQRLNDTIWDNINDLVFGDFNGDGVTDIATDFGKTAQQMQQILNHPYSPPPPQPIVWYVSWSGRDPWQVLNTWTPARGQIVQPLANMLIGCFDGNHATDILDQMKSMDDSLIYFYLSGAGKTPPVKRSAYTVQ